MWQIEGNQCSFAIFNQALSNSSLGVLLKRALSLLAAAYRLALFLQRPLFCYIDCSLCVVELGESI